MTDNAAIEVLKMALLLERQGMAFYEQVAGQTRSPAVRELFRTLAEEEKKHAEMLAERGGPVAAARGAVPDTLAKLVLSGDIRKQIGAASYEAAAISAAIDMENKAVALYSQRAGQAADPAERDLYQWLADWERGHQRFLARINQELLEEIWQDSGFWPF
jgi:rubrerythrin